MDAESHPQGNTESQQCLLCFRRFFSEDALAAHIPRCARQKGAALMTDTEADANDNSNIKLPEETHSFKSPKKPLVGDTNAEEDHMPNPNGSVASASQSSNPRSASPTGRSARDLLASRRHGKMLEAERAAIASDWCRTALQSLESLQQENNEMKEKMTRTNSSFASWDGKKYCRLASPPPLTNASFPAAPDDESGASASGQNADGEVASPQKRSLSVQPPSRGITFKEVPATSQPSPVKEGSPNAHAPRPEPFHRSSTADRAMTKTRPLVSPSPKRAAQSGQVLHWSPQDDQFKRGFVRVPKQTVKRGASAAPASPKKKPLPPPPIHRDPNVAPSFMNATAASMRRSAGTVGATTHTSLMGLRVRDIAQRAQTAQRRVVAVAVLTHAKRISATDDLAKPVGGGGGTHSAVRRGSSPPPQQPTVSAAVMAPSVSVGHRTAEIPATVAQLQLQTHASVLEPAKQLSAPSSMPQKAHVHSEKAPSASVHSQSPSVRAPSIVARFCSECGQRYVSETAKFCVQCGHRREFAVG